MLWPLRTGRFPQVIGGVEFHGVPARSDGTGQVYANLLREPGTNHGEISMVGEIFRIKDGFHPKKRLKDLSKTCQYKRMEWMIGIDWNVFLLLRAFESQGSITGYMIFLLSSYSTPAWPMAYFRDFLTSAKRWI